MKKKGRAAWRSHLEKKNSIANNKPRSGPREGGTIRGNKEKCNGKGRKRTEKIHNKHKGGLDRKDGHEKQRKHEKEKGMNQN